MDERKAGRIVGTFMADFLYFSIIFGTGIFSIKLISKLIKIAVTKEAMRSVNKQNNHANNDIEHNDLE
jgi:hypothetical protein